MKFNILHKKKIELSDEDLLALYCKGSDIKHFQQLYERYIPLVYGLSIKYLKDEHKAQDVVIDLFESLHSKIHKYTIDNFNNWLFSVVKHHCFQQLREKKKEILVDFDSDVMESDDIINLFDDEEIDKEKEEALKGCLEKLPDVQKESVMLFFYEEKSYADIVDITGYNLKSVKSYLQNGRRNLKICIENKLKI